MFLSHVKMKINQRDIYILLRLNLLFYWRKTWDFHSTATDLWGLRGSFPLLLPPIPPCLAVTRAWKAQVTTISGFSWWKSSRWKKKKKCFSSGVFLLVHLAFGQRHFHPTTGTWHLCHYYCHYTIQNGHSLSYYIYFHICLLPTVFRYCEHMIKHVF